jgi:hypothetical protein
VHDPSTAPTFAGIVSPVKLKAVWPAVKLFVEAPTHEPVAEPAALMNMFVSVSVKFAPVSATEFGLVIVKLIWLVPPTAMVGVTNAFAIAGDCVVTTRHCGVTPLLTRVIPVICPAVLVKAAGGDATGQDVLI